MDLLEFADNIMTQLPEIASCTWGRKIEMTFAGQKHITLGGNHQILI
jgi:hypothetical protein